MKVPSSNLRAKNMAFTQLTTPNVILKAADYITAYLPIAAPIPYENPLLRLNVFNCQYQNDIFVRAAMGDLQYILYT